MSKHEVRVIRIREIEKHPNADRLGLVRIEGFTAIVRLGDFTVGDLAAYIEPDYVVPGTDQFAFLGDKLRIRSQKLRGIWSQGLLVKAPDGAREGDDVMERLGIKRYEPPTVHERRVMSGRGNHRNEIPHPSLAGLGVYDLENWRKHQRVLTEGERVIITEKIHGTNARFAYRAGRMWVGSRNQWKHSGELSLWQRFSQSARRPIIRALPFLRPHWQPIPNHHGGNMWWQALRENPWIEEFCKANQDAVLYGEVYGWVQDLRYGASESQIFFRAFDVFQRDRFVDAADFLAMFPLAQRAPLLFDGPYCPSLTEELSRLETSALAPHMPEGIVIKPAHERWHGNVGRVALKLVSDRYLERAA